MPATGCSRFVGEQRATGVPGAAEGPFADIFRIDDCREQSSTSHTNVNGPFASQLCEKGH